MSNYILFISPIDYFGSHGERKEVGTLREAIDIIEHSENDNKFIRLEKDRVKKGYWRVLFKPCDKEGVRPIQATNDHALVDRIFCPIDASKS